MNDGGPHIVIVGGGTAGWMTAAYLERRLAWRTAPLRITLIESDEVPPIGVGEATIPSIVTMMRDLEIPEYRLLAEADATFKNAIKFVGWASSGQASPDAFYHQFDAPPATDGRSAIVHWLALKSAGIEVEPLDVATCVGSALCEANRAPKLFQSPPYEAPVPYAYHIDAVKLGLLLRSVAESRGVHRLVGHVLSADRDEDGNIVAVQTRDGRDIEGDFFIDCSGFRGLLIEKVLGEEFVSFGDRLICDSAVTCQVPHVGEKPALRSYTTCTAHEEGWTWEIDLQSRSGVGYVYSSKFVDDERARQTLLGHVGAGAAGLPTRKIDMRIGRRADTWVKNCLAVGLSGGFLEPLESTGIHLIELALRVFVDHFDLGPGQSILRRQYNKLMREVFDEIADFLIMHYSLNGRHGEPFWDHCRERVELPASLVDKLRLWSVKVPDSSDLSSKITVFGGFSYSAILSGLDAMPHMTGNLSPFTDLKKSAEVLDAIRAVREQAVNASPPHEELVQKMRAVGN